jgi:ornithine carrier protein
MPVMGAMAENATLFVVYSQTQAFMRRHFPVRSEGIFNPTNAPLPLSQMAIAGGCAGAVTSFVLTPIELVKVRMQVQMISQEASALAAPTSAAARTALPGPLQLFQSVLAQRGFKGLWLGQTGTFIREAGGSVAWFSAFEAVARAFIAKRQTSASPGRIITKDDLSSAELMLAGACAGAGYTVVLFPADCIKSTIQTGDELAKGRKDNSFLAVGKEIYRGKGLRGLYSGCGVTVVRSAPSSALIFWIYSLLERHFG